MKAKTLTSMNISLPAALRERLEEKLANQAYGSASEYVRELIRKDLQRKDIEQVDQLLLEGLRSPAEPLTSADWQAWRRAAGERPSRRHAAAKTRSASRR